MATVDVTIVVIRNANAPKFLEKQYQKTVSQDTPLGEAIIGVNATDGDGVGIVMQSIRYRHELKSSFSSSLSQFYAGSMYDDIRLHATRPCISFPDSPFTLGCALVLSNLLFFSLNGIFFPCASIPVAPPFLTSQFSSHAHNIQLIFLDFLRDFL